MVSVKSSLGLGISGCSGLASSGVGVRCLVVPG